MRWLLYSLVARLRKNMHMFLLKLLWVRRKLLPLFVEDGLLGHGFYYFVVAPSDSFELVLVLILVKRIGHWEAREGLQLLLLKLLPL